MFKKHPVIFIDIDTQHDFCHPKGNLYVPGAESLTPVLQKLISHAVQHGIPILASADAHAPDDPEFNQFPAHCVRGTAGQAKIDATTVADALVIAPETAAQTIVQQLQQHDLQAVVLEKQAFDVFANPHTDTVLQASGAETAVVFGVATDYCVRAAVLGLKARKLKVIVVEDAIKAVTPAGEADAFKAFAAAEVDCLPSDEILRRYV
ncbi:MAG: cysteine hydrolase [Candidatus Sericytochromatia bacterium]|nr:cysteine hydrolase [Candidatus Sericytochromatia bacterium]